MSDADTPFEFLQAEGRTNIRERLERSINHCSSLKAAVAFFNIDSGYFKNLVTILSQENSFFCVDIHATTDIQSLNDFFDETQHSAKGQPNLFLFMGGKKLDEVEKLCKKLRKGEQSNKNQDSLFAEEWFLLHAKLLLFTFDDKSAEIWIGSQNFTHVAIDGNNLESTMVIKTTNNTEEYKQVEEYLCYLKNECIAFDPEHIECYDKIQDYLSESNKSNKSRTLQDSVMRVICSDAKEISGEILVVSVDSQDIALKRNKQMRKLSAPVGECGSTMLVIIEDRNVQTTNKAEVVVPVTGIVPASSEASMKLITTFLGQGLHDINGLILRLDGLYPYFFKLDADKEKKEKQLKFIPKIIDAYGRNFVNFRISITGMSTDINSQESFFSQDDRQKQHELYSDYYQKKLEVDSPEKSELEKSELEMEKYNEQIVIKEPKNKKRKNKR